MSTATILSLCGLVSKLASSARTHCILISDQKINKAEVVETQTPDSGVNASRSAYAVNLASLAEKVNHKDIVKYLPDGLLTDAQRELKWQAIAKTIRYTNAKNDRKYADYIAKGDLRNARRMVFAAAELAMKNSKVRDEEGKLLTVLEAGADDREGA